MLIWTPFVKEGNQGHLSGRFANNSYFQENSYESRYSRMDKAKFREDSLQKILNDMVCPRRYFLKAVFHKFY